MQLATSVSNVFNPPVYAPRVQSVVADVFKSAYGWMCGGLALSGIVAWLTVATGLWYPILTTPLRWVCIAAELGLVWWLSASIENISLSKAKALYCLYAVVNGLTLSVLFIAFDAELLSKTFFITAGMFGGCVLFGNATQRDLSRIGSICAMALWGVILASVVNLFCQSESVDYYVSFFGVAVFIGLTMWDAQKIRVYAYNASSTQKREEVQKAAIIGALELYLDFINLFLCLLRLLGGRRR